MSQDLLDFATKLRECVSHSAHIRNLFGKLLSNKIRLYTRVLAAQVLMPEMKSGLLRDQEYQMQVANQVTREMIANQVIVVHF